VSTTLTFAHELVIVDASCMINLCATGRVGAILRSIPRPVAIASYVHEQEILRFDLGPAIEEDLLGVISPSEDEDRLTVNFAASVDDGEAVTCAIALNRAWTIGIDDRRAVSVFARAAPHIQVVSSLELLKHWADSTGETAPAIREALQNVRQYANFELNERHALYSWWEQFVPKDPAG
jgi:predicted nucleic acid-binding protein